jgi:hypothetical protein
MSFFQPFSNTALKSVKLSILIAIMLTQFSCAAPTIKITSDAMDMSLIAGEWDGEFSSQESGNSGKISLKLAKDGNNANGQVFMKGRLGPIGLNGPLVSTYSRPLPIKFVHIEKNIIEGKVIPFKDLKNNVMIHTSFKGKIEGDVMEGTYISTIEKTEKSYTGTWKVTRQK